MKVKFLFLVFFVIIPLKCFPQNKPDKDFLEKMSFYESQKYKKVLKAINSGIGNEYDLKYHRLSWKVDPAIRYIKGEVFSRFVIKGGTDNLSFDLSDSLRVDSVSYHGGSIDYSHRDDYLEIYLPEFVQGGVTDSLLIYYQGIPVDDSSFTFIIDEHEGVPVMWTLSEPYGSQNWWPCKHNLNDKIDSIDIFVNTPAEYRVASNGILLSEEENAEWKTFHWKHNHPVAAYLIAFAVTNYDSFTNNVLMESGRNFEVLNYVYPEDKEDWMEKSTHIVSQIELFSELFIEYPYSDEKYGHAQFSRGGGLEHQTMSFMANLGFELMAHELAHQWFGDYVTCGSWHDIWLNEGFATYLAGLSYEHLLEGKWWPVWKRLNIERVTSEPDGSVYVADTTDEARMFDSRLSYSKGALVLHMLRNELGDEAFYMAINNYLNDPNIANSYALTSDLKYHFEAVADTTLTEFFQDWIYGEGYPEYYIDYSQDEMGNVVLEIRQSTTHRSVDFFELTVPIKFQGSERDTIIYFHNTQQGQIYSFSLGYKIDSLVVDPEYHLITRNPVITSINNIIIEEKIRIYPNPFTSQITIIPSTGYRLSEIELIDIKGALIRKIPIKNNSDIIKIDLSEFKSGSYYCIIREKNKRKTIKKIIKI